MFQRVNLKLLDLNKSKEGLKEARETAKTGELEESERGKSGRKEYKNTSKTPFLVQETVPEALERKFFN